MASYFNSKANGNHASIIIESRIDLWLTPTSIKFFQLLDTLVIKECRTRHLPDLSPESNKSKCKKTEYTSLQTKILLIFPGSLSAKYFTISSFLKVQAYEVCASFSQA